MDDYIRALQLVSDLSDLSREIRFPFDKSFTYPTFSFGTIYTKPSISFYNEQQDRLDIYTDNITANAGTFADGLKRLEEYHDRYYGNTGSNNSEPARN